VDGGFVTFFLSAILDNLTTTIVMVSLMKKLLDKREDRLFFAGIIVIAANAGGAWTPIGDVTTTMLWIGGQITAVAIMKGCSLPSMVNLLVPLAVTAKVLGTRPVVAPARTDVSTTRPHHRTSRSNLMFYLGWAFWCWCRPSKPSPTCPRSWASCWAGHSVAVWAIWCTANKKT
jgi:Na+/H+ antiporter NhaD/arsenite permease-like protein